MDSHACTISVVKKHVCNKTFLLLQFLYTGNTALDGNNVLNLYQLSLMLLCGRFQAFIEKYMETNLTDKQSICRTFRAIFPLNPASPLLHRLTEKIRL